LKPVNSLELPSRLPSGFCESEIDMVNVVRRNRVVDPLAEGSERASRRRAATKFKPTAPRRASIASTDGHDEFSRLGP
jgi:hypothetical protein